MSFMYLLHKLSLPQSPAAAASEGDTLKSPRGTNNNDSLKSPRSNATNPTQNKTTTKPSSSNTKSAQPPPPEPEPKPPIEEVVTLNFDLDKIIVLLDKIREVCCLQDVDQHLDLVNFKTGECVMAHVDPFQPGSKYLKKGEKYFPCKVIITTTTPSTPPPTTNTKKNTAANSPSTTEMIEKTFISLVSGDAADQLPTIIDPTKKTTTQKKK